MSKKDRGFTLLELMIAIGIFSIILFTVAQMMRAEIGFFNVENTQNQNEQRARSAINHVLDQVRLYGYVTYIENGEYDHGLYSQDPDGAKCLLNLNPGSIETRDSSEMYYLPDQNQLWYNETTGGSTYLIADQISILEIEAVNAHLAKIRVVAGDPDSDLSFELITWGRLY